MEEKPWRHVVKLSAEIHHAKKKDPTKKVDVHKDSETPTIDQNENFSKLSRKEALNENERIKFENNNVIGTISLLGAVIDDLTFIIA